MKRSKLRTVTRDGKQEKEREQHDVAYEDEPFKIKQETTTKPNTQKIERNTLRHVHAVCKHVHFQCLFWRLCCSMAERPSRFSWSTVYNHSAPSTCHQFPWSNEVEDVEHSHDFVAGASTVNSETCHGLFPFWLCPYPSNWFIITMAWPPGVCIKSSDEVVEEG